MIVRTVDGGESYPLSFDSPKRAIEKYFMPDMRPPVSVLIIEATDKDGKRVRLYLDDSNVSFEVG